MPTLKLTYFDSPGRAEPIRIALRVAGIPFEDVRLKFPAFSEARAKGDFPLGSVPMLEVEGVKIVQTAAILRYVARIGDRSLYPEDAWLALLVDSALDTFNDTLSHALTPSIFERDLDKKLAMRAELAAGPLARVYGYVESLIAQSGGPFVAGAAMSIADLVVAAGVLQIQIGHFDGLNASHLEAFPRVRALADAYRRDPRIAALG